jgi:hypothetical protein
VEEVAEVASFGCWGLGDEGDAVWAMTNEGEHEGAEEGFRV